MVICIIPFASMTYFRTDSTTENKKLKELPSVYSDGLNVNYLNNIGEYFEDHFAFRNEMVDFDSLVQSNIFSVSNMNTIVKGKNGWLYYSDTLDDYLGRNVLSKRCIYNISNNLSIIQKYVEDKGADFVLTIAPNKNSLYDENMPYYYSKKSSNKKNINMLIPLLKSKKINYTDLFSLFKKQDEILYLKRDSHWNNKGALLVYNEIMNNLNREHNDYSLVKSVRTKTEYGDLNKMLYPVSAQPEWNYFYKYDYGYRYISKTKSVEDAWIETKNDSANGKLLMFRDSFGNTLLPFFAQEFKSAYFSKVTPYPIDEYMESYNPDCVVIEKVERNIDEFAYAPPLMTGIAVKNNMTVKKVKSNTSLAVNNTDLSSSYLAISGVIDKKFVKTNTNIYVSVTVNGNKTTYIAFNISDNDGDNGYILYLPKDKFMSVKSINIDVITDNNGNLANVKSSNIDIGKFK